MEQLQRSTGTQTQCPGVGSTRSCTLQGQHVVMHTVSGSHAHCGCVALRVGVEQVPGGSQAREGRP
eukprot:2347276-Rhodomonas_salina.2